MVEKFQQPIKMHQNSVMSIHTENLIIGLGPGLLEFDAF